jgi:hypothetical protein
MGDADLTDFYCIEFKKLIPYKQKIQVSKA